MKFSDVIKTLCLCGCVFGGMCGDVGGMERRLEYQHNYSEDKYYEHLRNFLKKNISSVEDDSHTFFDVSKCRLFISDVMKHRVLSNLLEMSIPNDYFYIAIPLQETHEEYVRRLNDMLFLSSEKAVDFLKREGIDRRKMIDSFVDSFNNCDSQYLGCQLAITFRGVTLGSFKALEFFGWNISTTVAHPMDKFEEFMEMCNNLTNMRQLGADLIAFAYASGVETIKYSISDFEDMFGVVEDYYELLDIGDERTNAYGAIMTWRKNGCSSNF